MSERNKLDKIDEKIDKIQEKISAIDVTLSAQHESLKIHIKRTNLLEEKLQPVEDHVIMVNGVLKFIGFLAVLVGIVAALAEIKGNL